MNFTQMRALAVAALCGAFVGGAIAAGLGYIITTQKES